MSPFDIDKISEFYDDHISGNELDKEKLYVAEAYAGQGTTMKRLKANARGSASRIRKRTSHITVVLKERA